LFYIYRQTKNDLSKKSKNTKIVVGDNSKTTIKAAKNKTKGSLYLNMLLKPQNIFLILATAFGLSFIFTIPPFQVPDEASHMFRAYQFTKLEMRVEEKNNVYGNFRAPSKDNIVWGTYLPSNLDSVQMKFVYLKFQPQNKTKKKAILDACSIKLEQEKQKFTEMTASAYSFFSYIPQIPAIIIGRIVNLNVIPLLYLGRIFALAFYIFCVWYSIKIIPFGKYISLIVGLMPMSLSLAGSYSGDCVIISFAFLAVALSMYFITQDEINLKNKKLISLLIVISLLGVLKPSYFPFVFIIFLLPKRAFLHKREYYFTLLIAFATSIIFVLGWRYLSNINQVHNPAFEVKEILETPAYQLNRIMSDPLIVFDIFYQTFTVKGEFYYRSLIGVLGYLDTFLPFKMYKLYYLLLIIVALFDFNKLFQLSIFQRGLIFCLSIGMFLATILAMFIIDGAESKDRLVTEGVQGRYFIPPLILFLFTFYRLLPDKKAIQIINKLLPLIIFIFCFAMLYMTEHTIYLRYFKFGDDYFKYINS
jgi:uncharacterized membrane protein